MVTALIEALANIAGRGGLSVRRALRDLWPLEVYMVIWIRLIPNATTSEIAE
jgi:hypothetical protein